MKQKIATRRMRAHPDLEQIKRQAKELWRGFVAGEPAASAEVRAHYHAANATTFALHDAQLVMARSYGFASWPKLKAYVDGVTVARLAEAVRGNDLARVRRMLKSRPEMANLKMSYGDEHRPLHYAVMGRLPEMVRLLLRHGADARAGIHPHRAATTALTIAREREYLEIVAIIEKEEHEENRAAPEVTMNDGEARAAVESGDETWLRARHARGDFVNPVRWNGGGLLALAVRQNRPEMLALLLEFGFDPDERVTEGEGDWVAYSQGYPLWECAALGRREMAELLLGYGANPNVHVDSSGSPVHSAYSHQQWAMVELLRRHGGVVTADTAAIYRQTELARQMLAEGKPVAEELLRFGAMGGAAEIVRLALERIEWAREDGRWFRMLKEPLYFSHHFPWSNARNKEFDRATYLTSFRHILGRCDPNVKGSFGRTALHEVAAMGDWVTDEEAVEFARALLEAGARMDSRDNILQSTPLGWACRWGRAGVARVLLDAGADTVEPEAEAWAQPRRWAEKMGHASLVELLQAAR